MANIIYSKNFVRQFERLSNNTQEIAYTKIDLFKKNPKNPSLKTHKLHGELKEYFSFSVDYKIRIVFEYIDSNTISFSKIGDHKIYK